MNSIGAAWESWTPTVTPDTGAFTTLGTVTAKYCRINKLFIGYISIAITTNGTAGGSIKFTFPTGLTPNTNAAGTQIGFAREYNITGTLCSIWIYTGKTAGAIQTYANTYPGANGYAIGGMFAYEI